MNYLQNHIWCSDSNWGGHYYCRHLVSLTSYVESDKEDWDNIINPKRSKYFDEEMYTLSVEALKKFSDKLINPEFLKDSYHRDVMGLREHVYQWLVDNVKDRNDKEQPKGWCIGSDAYTSGDSCSSYAIFFHRKSDAMKFIKTFSKWKKPVNYCQYFSDVRKTLDLETLKYEIK